MLSAEAAGRFIGTDAATMAKLLTTEAATDARGPVVENRLQQFDSQMVP